MNFVSGSILLVLLSVVVLAPRRWAFVGMTAGVFFLSQAHFIMMGGVQITPLRFLEAAGFLRVIARGELSWRRLCGLDWILLVTYNYTALVWLLREADYGRPLSLAFDATLCYLTFRALIRGVDDVRWFLEAFAALLVPFTILVVYERFTNHSGFAAVGAAISGDFRKGVLRCQGIFRHPVLLGSVAAAFFALYVSLLLGKARRAVASLGCILCLILVVLSNSGGPLTSTAAACGGWAAWVCRRRMWWVRTAAFCLLTAISLVMKDSIWYLPFKISKVVGGTGYHRAVIMEKAWAEIGKWWLAGMPIQETASWMPYVLFYGGSDITNHYLLFGIHGGVMALLLFIGILVVAFRSLGRTLLLMRSSGMGRAGEYIVWGLGVALFVHSVSWIGVAYFDQSSAVWLLHVALVASVVADPAVASNYREAVLMGGRARVSPSLALRQC
jgi:hypothetical protein